MFARDDLVDLDRRIEGAGQGHVLDDGDAAFLGQFADTEGLCSPTFADRGQPFSTFADILRLSSD